MERVRPYIIAEIGFNHEGDMGLARKMIKEAAAAGADAVKFQTYRAEDLALPSSPHFEAIKCGEMDLRQHRQLAKTAKDCGVDFLSTPYSRQAVDLLESVGVKAYKIASMDLNNAELLSCVARTGKRIILSTGMAGLSEIVSTIKMLRGLKSGAITLLHCLSVYPADPVDINLSFMEQMRKACKCPVGYSDHMKGTFACFLAAVLGAQVIEKHFTLDVSRSGGDHYHSADPVQLKKLIEDIDTALSIIGSGDNFKDRPDSKYRNAYRRGIYARVNIPKGRKILREHLSCCRPESGLTLLDLGRVIGRIARKDIKINSSVEYKDLCRIRRS